MSSLHNCRFIIISSFLSVLLSSPSIPLIFLQHSSRPPLSPSSLFISNTSPFSNLLPLYLSLSVAYQQLQCTSLVSHIMDVHLHIPSKAIQPGRFPSICSFSLQSDALGESIRHKKTSFLRIRIGFS